MLGVDTSGDLFTGPDIAAGNHDLRAVFCHFLGNRLPDAA
jgi:hypothetical protein